MKKLINNNLLKKFCGDLDDKNLTMALVPTMGALHEGHLALIKEGMKQADICLPYIYLNPTQFAAGEDLDQYPKTLEADIDKLEDLNVAAVWLPSTHDIYPNGSQITHKAGALGKPLEGEYRPHFFDGVVTVLHRMFELSKPDYVMMGEKDFQQLQVTKHMAAQYFPEIDIIGVPTIRDKNGLALSSRNVYLNPEEYEIAICLNQILKELAQGAITEKKAHQKLLSAGFDKIDYCTCRNGNDFTAQNPTHALAAVWLEKGLGKTRLIDNMQITT